MDEVKKLLDILTKQLNSLDYSLFSPLSKNIISNFWKRNEDSMIEYINQELNVYRDPRNERVIPVENRILNEFNAKTDSHVEKAMIHYGPNSDEITRSMHAEALTLGSAIYFRNSKYNPDTEEGRKILFHELTHIKQNKKDIIKGQLTKNELEKEAESSENKSLTATEKYYTIKLGTKEYKISEKQYKEIRTAVKTNLENIATGNSLNLSEDEYLKFLINYEKYIEGEF